MMSGSMREARQGWVARTIRGIPIPRTRSFPTYGVASAAISPVLAASNVTVARARTATGDALPVAPFKPEGISKENT